MAERIYLHKSVHTLYTVTSYICRFSDDVIVPTSVQIEQRQWLRYQALLFSVKSRKAGPRASKHTPHHQQEQQKQQQQQYHHLTQSSSQGGEYGTEVGLARLSLCDVFVDTVDAQYTDHRRTQNHQNRDLCREAGGNAGEMKTSQRYHCPCRDAKSERGPAITQSAPATAAAASCSPPSKALKMLGLTDTQYKHDSRKYAVGNRRQSLCAPVSCKLDVMQAGVVVGRIRCKVQYSAVLPRYN